MSKTKKLGKKFLAFVNQLSPDECRKQLVLAYIQMEKCMQVLRGEDVKPVAMKDNGESSDLELFYMCKKVAEELSTQEQENGTISMTVGFACDDAIEKCRRLRERLIRKSIRLPKPDEELIEDWNEFIFRQFLIKNKLL